MRKISYIKKSIALIILTLVLPSSCTQMAYRTLYNNLDHLLLYKINSFFNLNTGQKNILEHTISVHLGWHRSKALPRLIPIIKKAQIAIGNGFTETSEREIVDLLNAELGILVNHVSDDAVSFCTTITADQIEYFRKECNDYVSDIEKEQKQSHEKAISHRLDNLVSQLEMYYGDFSSSQKEDIRKLIESSSIQQNIRVPYLRATQSKFIQLLEDKADRAVLKTFITGWFTRDKKFIPKEFKTIISEQQKENISIHLLIDRTIITKEQRDEGIRKLDDLIATINTLINQ